MISQVSPSKKRKVSVRVRKCVRRSLVRSASSHIKRQRKMLEVWRLRVTTEPLLRVSTAVKSACQETLCARRDTIARNA